MNLRIWPVIPIAAPGLTSLLFAGHDIGAERVAIDSSDQVSESTLQRMSPEREKDALRLGFDLRWTVPEGVRKHISFLDYIERATRCESELVSWAENVGYLGLKVG